MTIDIFASTTAQLVQKAARLRAAHIGIGIARVLAPGITTVNQLAHELLRLGQMQPCGTPLEITVAKLNSPMYGWHPGMEFTVLLAGQDGFDEESLGPSALTKDGVVQFSNAAVRGLREKVARIAMGPNAIGALIEMVEGHLSAGAAAGHAFQLRNILADASGSMPRHTTIPKTVWAYLDQLLCQGEQCQAAFDCASTTHVLLSDKGAAVLGLGFLPPRRSCLWSALAPSRLAICNGSPAAIHAIQQDN